jgi:hypothetical protein
LPKQYLELGSVRDLAGYLDVGQHYSTSLA